jgi:hypothetical protein
MQAGRHRFIGARLCLGVAGALVLAALAWIPSTPLVARAATTGWSIVSSPNVGSQGDRFSADSCVSTTFCMAGGFFYDPAGTAAETLAEEWNGVHWAQVTTPNGSSDDFFSGMSCVSTTFCVAVGEQFSAGTDQNLIEQWSGTAWSIVTAPDKIGSSTEQSLLSVSCTSSTFCMAVGSYDPSSSSFTSQTLIEQWNGASWSIDTSPDTSGSESNSLSGVSCVSGSFCEAVGSAQSGSAYDTLAEAWGGTSWSIASSPNKTATQSNQLTSVSCATASFCAAVGWYYTGSYDQTLAEDLSGGSWSLVTSPDTSATVENDPYGVSCTSATFCVMVGDAFNPNANPTVNETLSELWEGTAWSIVASPNAGGHNSLLNADDCVSVSFCVAAGLGIPTTGSGGDTLIEQWNGDPPVVGAVTPAAGPVAGGQVVTVTGSGFGAGMTVTIGGTSVTPSSVTATSFKFTTPAESAGYDQIQVTTALGSSALTSAAGYIYAGLGNYVPLTPFRILDTRPTSVYQRGTGALGPGTVRTLQITGVTGLPSGADPIPATATAVVLNVTEVSGSASSLLTVYPNGTGRPNASNLNFTPGTVTPNLVTAVLGQSSASDPNREVNIYNAAGTVNVLADVEGYFEPEASGDVTGEFHPIAPVRVCDTRSTGAPGQCRTHGILVGGAPMVVNVTGSGADAIPETGASAAVLNLTGVAGSASTFLSVYPTTATGTCGTTAPAFSTLNLVTGEVEANRVMVALGPAASGGPDNSVCVYNAAGNINVILDANGWFGSGSAAAGDQYQPIGPSRICDTRTGSGLPCAGETLGSGGIDHVVVAGEGGVPASGASHPALAVIANLTAIAPSAATYLTLYPANLTKTPGVSDLNVNPGEVLPNLAVVQIDTTGDSHNGDVDLFNAAGNANAVIDIEGWFQ